MASHFPRALLRAHLNELHEAHVRGSDPVRSAPPLDDSSEESMHILGIVKILKAHPLPHVLRGRTRVRSIPAP